MQSKFAYIILSAIFLTIGFAPVYAQEPVSKSIPVPPQKESSSITGLADSLTVNATELAKIADSTRTDTIKKPLLTDKIKYKAETYTKIDQKQKKITLYDKAELYYQDIELTSGVIVLDYEKKEIYAGRIKDSTGRYTQLPVFKQGQNVVEPDSIRVNYVTKKALVWNSRTEQGEFRVKAEITKKENDSVYFMKKARFTTAKDIDNPEYYFVTDRVKLVPGKKVVVGVTNMVIADVPTPIALPFAFFPMTTKAESGILVPTYGETRQRGYSLQNGGYYFALSDNYDLAILGDYFTNGSYGLRFESNYAKRYRFQGTVNVRFENLINSERGFPDYSRQRIYNIQWTHAQDNKANPNSRFSATVNLGSSEYFRQSINQVNVGSQLNNTLSSSVSYSKTFASNPQVNLTFAATHAQNTNTGDINMTLPTFQGSVDRIFPFAPKNGIKKGFFRNINFQYNVRGENRIQTNDSLFFKSEMWRDANSGFQHSIPLSTNFKIFKYFSATANVNYEEVWYFKTIRRGFDEVSQRVVDRTERGFDAFRTYSFSSSIGTTIYGTFNRGENRKLKALRHVIRPSVSWSYVPSFDRYYDTYDPDGSGTMRKDYTRFEGGIFGAPGRNFSHNLGFSINNTLEAKVADRDTTKTEARKIMLLNNLNLSGSYNMAADSLRLSPLRVSGGTVLFKDKLNVNFAATLDPYAIDNAGRRINTFNVDNGGSLFRMTSANMTLGYSIFSDGSGNQKREDNIGVRNGGREDDLFGTNVDFSDRRESQFDNQDENDAEAGFFNAKIPFDLTLAYALTYGNTNRENKIIGNSLMVSANTDLTPKWRIGISTGYDFVQKGVTFTQLRFERDLLSWRMDFNWTPLDERTSWFFFIGIKSGVLSDIKWEKRNQEDRQLR